MGRRRTGPDLFAPGAAPLPAPEPVVTPAANAQRSASAASHALVYRLNWMSSAEGVWP